MGEGWGWGGGGGGVGNQHTNASNGELVSHKLEGKIVENLGKINFKI